MDITILTMPTGLMLTCETSECQVEICNFDNIFFNKQTLLFLYAIKIRILYILVPEESSFDWFCIPLLSHYFSQ